MKKLFTTLSLIGVLLFVGTGSVSAHPGHRSCGIALGPNQGLSGFAGSIGKETSDLATSAPNVISDDNISSHSRNCEQK